MIVRHQVPNPISSSLPEALLQFAPAQGHQVNYCDTDFADKLRFSTALNYNTD